MKIRLLIGLATGLFVVGAGSMANAAPVTINFDDFSSSSGPIDNFYMAQGVKFFYGNSVNGMSTGTSGSAWVLTHSAAVSGDKLMIGYPGTNNDIIANFYDAAGQRTTTDYASINNDLEATPSDIVIAAYDQADSLLGLTPISGGGAFGEVSYDDIWYVMIYGAIGSPGNIGVDNFSFNYSPVPVPAAVWLFNSGLLGLVGMARRKKAA